MSRPIHLKVLASGALVAACIAGVTVGTTLYLNQPDVGRDGAAADAESGWAARAAGTYATWAGTPDQQQAAEVVVAFELNGEFSECMKSKGFPRAWQKSIGTAPVARDGLIYSFWAAGRLDGYYSQKVANAEIGQRRELAHNKLEASGSQQQAELSCRKANPGASDDVVSALRDPAGVQSLIKAWTDALAPVLIAGGDPATYDRCVSDSAALQRVGATSSDEARKTLSAALPVGSVPVGDEPATAAWRAYLAKESAWVEADWACRAETRERVAHLVEPAVRDFEAKHADEIETASQHWSTVQARATELGWAPAKAP